MTDARNYALNECLTIKNSRNSKNPPREWVLEMTKHEGANTLIEKRWKMYFKMDNVEEFTTWALTMEPNDSLMAMLKDVLDQCDCDYCELDALNFHSFITSTCRFMRNTEDGKKLRIQHFASYLFGLSAHSDNELYWRRIGENEYCTTAFQAGSLTDARLVLRLNTSKPVDDPSLMLVCYININQGKDQFASVRLGDVRSHAYLSRTIGDCPNQSNILDLSLKTLSLHKIFNCITPTVDFEHVKSFLRTEYGIGISEHQSEEITQIWQMICSLNSCQASFHNTTCGSGYCELHQLL